MAKASPLFDWTFNEVFTYLAANDIPVLSLYSEGYTSIGCEPCTAKPEAGAHARSGRWGGAKLECGLHTVSVKEA
jgi:phosphoadenosine phosphosulfate reductase